MSATNTQPASAASFRIWTCGAFRVERRVGESYQPIGIAEWGGSTYPRLLLKGLLCCAGRRARRDTLQDMLWRDADPEQAVQFLNRATSKLRSVLQPGKAQASLLLTTEEASHYRLDEQARVWVDADAALVLLEQAEHMSSKGEDALALLEEAAQYLAGGPFLDGDDGLWLYGRRSTIEIARHRCLLWLATLYEQRGRVQKAQDVLLTAWQADMSDEDVLCRVMSLLHRQGMTSQALKLYQRTTESLAQDELAPTETTRALAERLHNEVRPIELQTPVESLSTVFPLILKVVQNMPEMTRRQLMLLGAAAMVGSAGGSLFLPILEKDHISASMRDELTVNLGESISQGWQQFHHLTSEQTLLLSQTQLLMVQQSHHHLHPAAYPYLYSGVYRLMGAALFFQARYSEAQTAHQRAYITSVESGDSWNIAQSLAWQAYSYQANQDYISAMQTIEKALRLLDDRDHENEMDIRLKGHLLALWAENANINANRGASSSAEIRIAQKRLEESAHLLDHITPNEEFDRLHWLQISGKCALEQKKFKLAIAQFEEALATLPQTWLMRHVLASVPLATAYACSRERDASLAVARKMLPSLATLKAPIINNQFASYILELEQIFPVDSAVTDFVTGELHPYLPLLGISRQ